MTRETRIGLLVGLVFIVMFGLVLSEFAGPGKNPSAQPVAGNAEDPYAYNVLPVIPEAVPENTPPPSAIATTDNRPSAGVEVAMNNPTTAITRAALVPPRDDGEAVIRSDMPRYVAVGNTTDATEVATTSGGASDAIVKGNIYIVKPGDNLIKIAREVYGQSHEKEYKKILEANRDVVRNELAIKAGDKLNIPPLPETARPVPATPATPVTAARSADAAGASTGNVRVVSARDLHSVLGAGSSSTPVVTSGIPIAAVTTRPAVGASAGSAVTATARPGKTYVVQPGDSLMKIARKTVKDDSKASIDKILALNKDKVASPQRLQVGTVLVIPG